MTAGRSTSPIVRRDIDQSPSRLSHRVTDTRSTIGAMFARRLLERRGTARHPPTLTGMESAKSRMNRHSLTPKNPSGTRAVDF